MRTTLLTMGLLACLAIGSQLSAQTFGIQNGPRAFWRAPVGTQAVDAKYDYLEAGVDINGVILTGFELNVQSAILSYSNYFELFGRTANVTAAIAHVWLDGDLNTIGGPIPSVSTSGFSDPYFQFVYPLIGGETIPAREFMTHEPGLQVCTMVATRPPLGDYDESEPANAGANRWEFRLALPVSYIWGTPTRQTSVEVIPMVYFFTDNTRSFGGVDLEQDMFFQLEGHITHDFSPMFWGSLNALYGTGGETKVDGVDQDNAVEYASIGATLGARLSRNLSMKLNYSERAWSESSASDGRWFSLSVSWVF